MPVSRLAYLDTWTDCFRPCRWLRGGHVQTIAAAYWGQSGPYRATQHFVSLPDGDRLVLHEEPLGTPPADESAPSRTPQLPPAATAESLSAEEMGEHPDARPIALLIHGLAGSHRSGYMQRTAAKLAQAGWRAVRMDQRGCGAGLGLARRPVHAGRSSDLAAASGYLAERFPAAPQIVVGYSLGAGMLLKWLGEIGHQPPAVAGAIAVAPPVDLLDCARNLRRPASRLYDALFAKLLTRQVRHWARLLPASAPPTQGSAAPIWPGGDLQRWRPRSLWEFDEQFTVPLGEFQSLEEYYCLSSAGPHLPRNVTPTLILAAENDPLIPSSALLRQQFSSTTRLLVTADGGHLGYLATSGWGSERVRKVVQGARRPEHDADWHWLDWRIVQWSRGLLAWSRNHPPAPAA